MPLVEVTKEKTALNTRDVLRLGQELPQIVAAALDVRGNLVPKEIEVRFRNYTALDVNHPTLAIIIWANEYPARKKNLDARRQQIAKAIREMPGFDRVETSVWVLLAPASYEEWAPKRRR